MKTVEFFSGIGGMHYGLKYAGIETQVIPMDINPNANLVYSHNFETQVAQKSIESLSLAELEGFGATLWTMSPPCQPYTRTGKQLDELDPRSKALLHLMSLLPKMANPPDTVFMENVPAFGTSNCHDIVLKTLSNYHVQEWILSPTDFGVPNHRPRYYLLATKFPIQTLGNFKVASEHSKVGFYLDTISSNKYNIPVKTIKTAFPDTIVASSTSTSTNCFTKGYASFSISSGSFLQTRNESIQPSSFKDPHEAVNMCGIRKFTPAEIARIHGFPISGSIYHHYGVIPCSFTFPETVNTKQCWKVLGNSLSVVVVGELFKLIRPVITHSIPVDESKV